MKLTLTLISFLLLIFILPASAQALSIDCTNADKLEPSFIQYARNNDAIIIKGKIIEVTVLNNSGILTAGTPNAIKAKVAVEKYWGNISIDKEINVLGPQDPWAGFDSTGFFFNNSRYFMVLKRNANGEYELYNQQIYCQNNSIINLGHTDLSEVELERELNQLNILPAIWMLITILSLFGLFVVVDMFAKRQS